MTTKKWSFIATIVICNVFRGLILIGFRIKSNLTT